MTETQNPEITSYSEQIFIFRKNVFLLRAVFYFILTISIILPVFNHSFPNKVVLICLILFALNIISGLLVLYRKLNITLLLYVQQLINIAGIILIIFFSGKSHSVFVLLFITEGFFCGILYNAGCILIFFAMMIISAVFMCITSESYSFALVLSIILSVFSTVSAFLIIREQENRKIEIISYYLRLEKLNSRLIGIGRLRKNFMDIAYHDMKSPLSTVIGFLQNILSGYGGPVTEKQEEWLNRCVDRLDSLSRQINDLYFLANIESTDFNEIKKRCDVYQEIELAIAEVSDKFQKKGQKFIKNVPTTLPWMVVVPILFRQCLVNLLGNASKYTPAGGSINLDVEYDDNWLTIRVSDTGIGIPDEFKPRVFDEFFRVKNTIVDNQKVSGTGLGLTIVKSITDGHGGTIQVLDNKPQGTVFIARFPMIKEYREA